MANLILPEELQLVSIKPRLVQPAQQNRSLWTGRSKIIGLPGAEYWTGQAMFRVFATEAAIRKARAFFFGLRGPVNTFDLPVTPTPQLNLRNPYGVNYPLVLDFENGVYAHGSDREPQLEAMPGYTFTRTGEQGTFDPSVAITLGLELVKNGNGVSVTGWSDDAYAVISATGGRLRVTANPGGATGVAYQAISTVAGKTYRLRASVHGVSGYGHIFLGTAAAGADVWNVGPNIAAGASTTVDVTFTALGATTYINLSSGSATAGQYAEYDNISVQEVTGAPVRYFAANVPAINGEGYHAYGALTNLLAHSQDFTQAAWIKVNSGTGTVPVVTANAAVAPDGSLTADRVVFSIGGEAANDYSLLQQGSVAVVAGAVTSSIWLKSATGAPQQVVLYTAESGGGLTSQVVTVTASWQRFALLHTNAAGGAQYFVFGSYGDAEPTVANGSDNSLDLHVWQGQMLQGAFADGGPIIRTAGAAASIGDSFLQVSAPPLAGDQVIFVNLGKIPSLPYSYFMTMSDGSTNERMVLYMAGLALPAAYIVKGGAVLMEAGLGNNIAIGDMVTVGLHRHNGLWWGFLIKNGALTKTAFGVADTPTINQIVVGNWMAGSNPANVPIKKVAVRHGTFTDVDIVALANEDVGEMQVPGIVGATKTAGGAVASRTMTLSTTEGLEPGMYGSVPLPSGHQRLFLVTSVTGNVIEFEPSMPESVANGVAVNFVRPGIRARLADPEYEYEDASGTVVFGCSVEEAL
jgi:hypothetical protein